MKKIVVLVLAAGLLNLAPLRGAEPVDEKVAIRQAALDYIEGWYEGNAERMDRALHPQLAKRMVVSVPSGQEQFVNLTKDQMVQYTKAGGGKTTPADKRAIKIDILDVYRDIACVRAESARYIDYLHLAKSDGKWKIVNVLWQNNVKERKEVPVEVKTLESYVGEYELQPGMVIVVTLENNRLYTQATGQSKVEIFPESQTDFFLKVVEAQLTFVKDDQGKVTQVILHQGGNDLPAKKIK